MTDEIDPTVLVWLLLELDGGVLVVRRKPDVRPLAGQWVLPGAVMEIDESASDTVARVGKEMLDIDVIAESFVDTLYFKESGKDYAVNVFSIAFEGQPRFRGSGPFADARWTLPAELPSPLPQPLAVLLQQEGGRPPKETGSTDGAEGAI